MGKHRIGAFDVEVEDGLFTCVTIEGSHCGEMSILLRDIDDLRRALDWAVKEADRMLANPAPRHPTAPFNEARDGTSA